VQLVCGSVCLCRFQQFLDVGWEATPCGALEIWHFLHPLQKLRVFDSIRHFEYEFSGILGLVKRIAGVERFRSEEHLYQTDQNFAIILIVDFTSIQILNQDSFEGIPRNLIDINVVSRAHRINILINQIQTASLICLVEFVDLSPSDWCVSQSLQNNSVQPTQ